MSIGRKKLAQGCHKIAVLASLMQDALDDVKPLIGDAHEFRDACKNIEEKCDEIITNVFDVKEIRTSSYLTELTNQVDTCIRKNFKPVSGPINP